MEKLLVLPRHLRGQGSKILLTQPHHEKSPGNGIIHFSVFIPKGTVQGQSHELAVIVVNDGNWIFKRVACADGAAHRLLQGFQVEIDPDLKSLQQAVGGNIGASYPFSDPVAIVYNDEGKLMGLPLNRALRDESGEAYDVVAGTFLVVGLGEEDFASLSPELAQKYEEHFHQPEDFIRLGHRMMVVRVPDEAVCPEESKTTPPKDAGFDR